MSDSSIRAERWRVSSLLQKAMCEEEAIGYLEREIERNYFGRCIASCRGGRGRVSGRRIRQA